MPGPASAAGANVRRVTEAAVHLDAQPRIDTLVTGFPAGDQKLRTDYAGVAWLGDQPDAESGIMGPEYRRRPVESRLFLPDTHWYDVDALDDVEVQVTGGLLQIPATAQQTQGLVGSLAEPVVEFFEHPEGEPGVGICLWLRGDIFSNVGLTYRVTVLAPRGALLRTGDAAPEPAGEPDSI